MCTLTLVFVVLFCFENSGNRIQGIKHATFSLHPKVTLPAHLKKTKQNKIIRPNKVLSSFKNCQVSYFNVSQLGLHLHPPVLSWWQNSS